MKIIYSDDHIAVVEKPEGLLSVPGKLPDGGDSVCARIKKLFPGCIEQPSVHRLDMDTSGLMVLALSRDAHRSLSIAFQNRNTLKYYTAVLDGYVPPGEGEIRLKFRLDPENRPRQIHDPVFGKEGVTMWRRLSEKDGLSTLLFRPVTGRTHQLRLHSAHPLGLGVPIKGDRLYGTRNPGERMLLHASELSFPHPSDGRIMKFSSPAPF